MIKPLMGSLFLGLTFVGAACGGTESDSEVLLPDVAKAEFVSVVDNPYFPLPVGAKWTMIADTPDGIERIEIEVLAETRKVNGVTATVVRDTAYMDDVIAEDTWDWYAQDTAGNVWYLGEDTCEYEGDECVDTGGSWEWGVDGALPGIVMWDSPEANGQPYYQEYFVGEAEDVGEVVAVDLPVSVPSGDFEDCIKTADTSTLDLSLLEHKYFCPGIGNALVEEEGLLVELTETSGLK